MMGLTRVQADCLRFIVTTVDEGGVPPSVDEIATHMGWASKSGAVRVLDALAERGAIRRLPNRPRAIEILPSRHLLAAVSDAALLAEVERRGL